ncbi:hypothetical protein JCM19314_2818 [Nonlabens ulvanivorans]|uniref:Uncharacterized protein n=1 Tax=Nonlabens ulvanivorans TaxID=906888 RepID=A0A081D7L8_NONUL|nr:hypothetical protein JCM19296_492 [Nonlabens ulvanivorans]GAK88344.1 hypothetical protein JCM19297_2857 [Nonlabens ulvanivorans]GAK98787.1 hypothetical protein JCM19314_2818 [Nonlabens ulvanivorans]
MKQLCTCFYSRLMVIMMLSRKRKHKSIYNQRAIVSKTGSSTDLYQN